MYNEIINIICSAIGVIGTIYAILSILNIKHEDIWKSVTFGGISMRDDEILIQREQARVGIGLIAYAWIAQLCLIFIKIQNMNVFCLCLLTILLGCCFVVIGIRMKNKKFRKEYEIIRENKKKNK